MYKNIKFAKTSYDFFLSPYLYVPLCAQSLSQVWFFVVQWTVAFQAPLPAHGILQARILEWVAVSFSRGSSQPRDQTHVSGVSYIGR